MADVITCVRIACAVLLLPCRPFSGLFYLFYAIGGISDALDGFVARRLGKVTEFGARLDTVADAAFFAVLLLKIYVSATVPIGITVFAGGIALMKFVTVAVGFIRRGKLVTAHTLANKICGALLFLLPVFLDFLPAAVSTAAMIFLCAVAAFASAQEGYILLFAEKIKKPESKKKRTCAFEK